MGYLEAFDRCDLLIYCTPTPKVWCKTKTKGKIDFLLDSSLEYKLTRESKDSK